MTNKCIHATMRLIFENCQFYLAQELLRLVSSNDMESFNTTASYLSDNLQPLPYTPFAAMLAKQQQNYASGSDRDNRSNDTYSIGVPGKNSVKEVSSITLMQILPFFVMKSVALCR